MSKKEKQLADDIIMKISHYGLLGIKADQTSRRMLWEKVFKSGWNTTKKVPPIPSRRPTREISQTAFPAGVLTQNASAPPGEARRSGAEAFIRPQISSGTQDLGIVFQWVDGRGRTLPSAIIRIDEDRTFSECVIQAIEHFDSHETTRVNNWNITVAVMWLRRRLTMFLKLVENRSTKAAQARVAQRTTHLENEGDLEQLVSVVDKLQQMKSLMADLNIEDQQKYDGLVDNGDAMVTDSDSDDSEDDDYEDRDEGNIEDGGNGGNEGENGEGEGDPFA